MLDMITDILQSAQRMTGMKSGNPVNVEDSAVAKQTMARQNAWTGNEYNQPAQPIGTDVKRYVEGHLTGNEDQMLTGRADLYARAGMNDRPFPEQLMGIADITDKADNRSRELLPKEAQAQRDQPSELKNDNLGGDTDTLRHTMLSAMMAKQHPIIGKLALHSHEAFGVPQFQSNPRESLRDTANNAQGWLLGENSPASDIEKNAVAITKVMSNKSVIPYLPVKNTADRQSVWGK